MTTTTHSKGTIAMLDTEELKSIGEALARLAYDYSKLGDRVGPIELSTRLVQAWCVNTSAGTDYDIMLSAAHSEVNRLTARD